MYEKLLIMSDDRFSEMCKADLALQMDLCCSNCKRRNTQATVTVESKIYQIDFYTTWLADVKEINRNKSEKVLLCTDCTKFMGRYSRVKEPNSWQFCWAAFYCSIFLQRGQGILLI